MLITETLESIAALDELLMGGFSLHNNRNGRLSKPYIEGVRKYQLVTSAEVIHLEDDLDNLADLVDLMA